LIYNLKLDLFILTTLVYFAHLLTEFSYPASLKLRPNIAIQIYYYCYFLPLVLRSQGSLKID